MQKIFWIGSPFFQASLTQLGYVVHFFNFEHVSVFTWDYLVNMAGFAPAIVVVSDTSRTPFVLGMENFPCFTVFYAVYTHIHSYYPYYAQGFDACLVSLKDHIALFQHKALPSTHIHWSPAFAKDSDMPPPALLAYLTNNDTKIYDYQWECLFVGTVHAQSTPTRKVFLETLQAQTPVHVVRGSYAQLFPQGRVVLNHCEHGDVNFRIFEALACGSALVTPLVAHGFTELFTCGKELLCYDRENMQDAFEKITYLQNNEEQRRAIALEGFCLVHNKHRAIHRAKSFVQFLEGFSAAYKQECIEKRREKASTIRKQWLSAPYLLLADAMESSNTLLREAYVKAAKGSIG